MATELGLGFAPMHRMGETSTDSNKSAKKIAYTPIYSCMLHATLEGRDSMSM